jgi:hypothetical protein
MDDQGTIRGMDTRFLSSLLSNRPIGTGGPFPWDKVGGGMMLITDIYLVQRLRMVKGGGIPQLPIHHHGMMLN